MLKLFLYTGKKLDLRQIFIASLNVLADHNVLALIIMNDIAPSSARWISARANQTDWCVVAEN
jgi:hypothetical protein